MRFPTTAASAPTLRDEHLRPAGPRSSSIVHYRAGVRLGFRHRQLLGVWPSAHAAVASREERSVRALAAATLRER